MLSRSDDVFEFSNLVLGRRLLRSSVDPAPDGLSPVSSALQRALFFQCLQVVALGRENEKYKNS
jgi:hypothetical protein